MVATGTYDKGVYKLDAKPHVQHASVASNASLGDLWHARFGHAHHRALAYFSYLWVIVLKARAIGYTILKHGRLS